LFDFLGIGIGIGYALTAKTEVEYLGTIADTPSGCLYLTPQKCQISFVR
jgi:hypothetical protein